MGLDQIYEAGPNIYGTTVKYTYEQYRANMEATARAAKDPKFQYNKDGEIVLNKKDFFDLYGLTGDNGLYINQLDYATGSKDFVERAYIWATQKYMVGDNVEFVIKADGTREIRNFSIELRPSEDPNDREYKYLENYDFEGGFLSTLAQSSLEPNIDPSGIGHTIYFKFINEHKLTETTITEQQFTNLYNENKYYEEDRLANINKLNAKGQGTIDGLFWDGDRPIAFLNDTKPIIYSSEEGGIISGTRTQHKVFGMFVDISAADFGPPGYDLDNNLAGYVQYGITYVGSKKRDVIYGTDSNDEFYGYGGNDELHGGKGDDILYGGEGNDVLRGGNDYDEYYIGVDKDDILDTDGNGSVYWGKPGESSQLTGGKQSKSDKTLFKDGIFEYRVILKNEGAVLD